MSVMQPIEAEVVADRFALELVFLNESSGELQCKGRPEAHGDLTCTVEVTHLAASCSVQDVPVCDALVTYKRSQIDRGVDCLGGHPAVDCWRYRPI